MKLVLLHSPLTGPMIWQRLVPLLMAQGHDVCVPHYRHVLAKAPPYYEKIAQNIARQSAGSSALIAHSGAGALVPVLANIMPLRTIVFADALLPHPGKCWFDTVPESLTMRLRGMAIDGRLPPWNRWWPEAVMEAMLPEMATRELFLADLQLLPLRYFEERLPAISLPENLTCAYLQLSSGYDAEVCAAKSRGWPTRSLALNHLAMLTHPERIADELSGFLQGGV